MGKIAEIFGKAVDAVMGVFLRVVGAHRSFKNMEEEV